jgi:hypothetical protein
MSDPGASDPETEEDTASGGAPEEPDQGGSESSPPGTTESDGTPVENPSGG